MCKLCWTLLLGAVIAVAIAIFLVAGGHKTTTATDGRQAITLEPHQRDLVLAEMRTFVDSLRDITQALGSNDSELFQQAALRVGLDAQGPLPESIFADSPSLTNCVKKRAPQRHRIRPNILVGCTHAPGSIRTSGVLPSSSKR